MTNDAKELTHGEMMKIYEKNLQEFKKFKIKQTLPTSPEVVVPKEEEKSEHS